MRPTLFILLFLTISSAASAQSRQQQKVDSIFLLVKKYFNAKNTDAIYTMAGESFKKEVSLTTLQTLFEKQLFPLGEIKDSPLISFVNNKIGTYKLKFDALSLQLLISLDEQDKIEVFLFQPFQEPVSNKTALVQTSNPIRSATDRLVDTAARTYIQKANTVGLCIGVFKDGKTSVYGYGETARRNGQLPNANTYFEIGSITKTFTSTILAYYVNAGKIKLTDPITKFLPDSVAVNPALHAITLVQLSNHTSGLPSLPGNFAKASTDPLNPYKYYNKALLYTYLKTCTPDNKPGEKYTYSNLAVGLLGTILQNISGKPFEQMVTDVVCRPLAMLSTAQYLNPLAMPRFTSVYNQQGNQTEPWDFDVLAPCGALHSTVSDLLIYAKANMHPVSDALSKAFALTHHITFTKDDLKLGLAWHIIVVDGVSYYFHDGATYGSSSILAFNPEKNIAVVVLSNAAENTAAVAVSILRGLQKQ